ncbi:hypothetical protein TSUD_201460 [Trifolium subterraneum]|nr:hypothetical protein TSUD_201460 [Trifolium subterraneum]
MPENYKCVMDEVVAETGKNITCLVTNAFYWFSADLAEEIHAKWVALWPAGPHSLLAHVYTDLIREKISSKEQVHDANLDFVPGFSEQKASDLPEEVLYDIDGPFATMLHKMGLELPRATAVAMNTFATSNPVFENEWNSKFKLLLNVGPFILTTPQRMISDEHGCVFDTFWMECIVGGVPMISRPFFGDHKLNARMTESVWDIGVGVDNGVLTKESTLKALELTMSSEKGRIMRHKILKLKEFAFEAVQQNGTSAKNFNTFTQIVTG